MFPPDKYEARDHAQFMGQLRQALVPGSGVTLTQASDQVIISTNDHVALTMLQNLQSKVNTLESQLADALERIKDLMAEVFDE